MDVRVDPCPASCSTSKGVGDDHADDWRELATREADGLLIALRWHALDGRVEVVVTDTWLDRRFEIAVPGHLALDAFRHPFLYGGSHVDASRMSSPRGVTA